MGLTVASTGRQAGCGGAGVAAAMPRPAVAGARIIALAGNPNVGKSTVFNALTGLRQHTGNWPGKTVGSAQGVCRFAGEPYVLVDIPGAYSLCAQSAEEEVARDFLCFGGADAVVIVCDATCLERNLNLVLQILEITGRAVVCVNLMDEAKRRGIRPDLAALSDALGVPCVGTSARSKRGLHALMEQAAAAARPGGERQRHLVRYARPVEQAIAKLQPPLAAFLAGQLDARFVAMRLLCGDLSLLSGVDSMLGAPLGEDPAVAEALSAAQAALASAGYSPARARDEATSAIFRDAEAICKRAVQQGTGRVQERQRRADRILTGRWTGLPAMLLGLLLVLYLTMAGANLPSALLSRALFSFQDTLSAACLAIGMPDWLHGALVLGLYRTLAWVISVMLPPMAIFFPLFTLLEDLGYLPRVAFNLDNRFRRCAACGKQALTMCMGFGCNAAGVIGCRIIDSPRERLIAILTNALVPCNGRFPMLTAVIGMFFAGAAGAGSAALLLTAAILLSVGMTFAASRFLSKTLLRGIPSSFTLELPPYRIPQVGRVLVRSALDRTLFVLARAASVAAPAGLLIYALANITVGGGTLLSHLAGALDPFGRLLGLDGVILMAFVLGLPANEIVIPIIFMAYAATGTLTEYGSLAELRMLLTAHGWTWLTALNMLLFSLFHWPCSTTLLAIRKETQSWKWAGVAALLPTAIGMGFCLLTATAARLLGLA